MEPIQRLFENTRILTVIGGYWGDCGKGKVTDKLAQHFDIVARFGGGCNAGHTVCTADGTKLVSHIIPCGLAQKKPCVLGRGVLFDLKRFLDEYDTAASLLGGSDKFPPIYIDEMCPIWTPWDEMIEQFFEASRGATAIGTTGKAQGPLATHNVSRIGPVVSDLFGSEDALRERLNIMLKTLWPQLLELKAFAHKVGVEERLIPSVEQVMDGFKELSPRISHMVRDTRAYLLDEYKNGANILVEGAQAVGLDRRWGTYPFVTSSSASSNGAPDGLGLPPKLFDTTLLIAKVFPTRVGAGPFPSELWDRKLAQTFPLERPELFELDNEERFEFLDEMKGRINSMVATPTELAQYLQVLGCEVGATTGRGRSVGLPDMAWLKYAVSVSGADLIALTRFDMLEGLDDVEIVRWYIDPISGDRYNDGVMPLPLKLSNIKTDRWMCDGVRGQINGCRNWDDLPVSGRTHIELYEEQLGIPVSIIGTGPDRDALIVRAP